jgi:hypothetical protein
MNVKSDLKLDTLFAAARAEGVPDTGQVEYGFETRLLARLREERASSVYSWAWKLCPFFAAIALAAGVWSRTTTARVQAESSIISEAANRSDEQLLVAYMTGENR